MNKLTEAFKVWTRLQPEEGTSCCAYHHSVINQHGSVTHLPDHKVCEREQAWRVYVRIRDNNPYYPFKSLEQIQMEREIRGYRRRRG